MSAWDNLSIREKAAMMRTAVSNGITNIDDIRREYNEFAQGGNIYAMGTPLTEEQRRALARQYFWENKMDKAQQYAVPSIYEGGNLPEVAVTAERLPFEYQNVAPTDNTFVAGTGRTQNPQAMQRAIQGGEQLNAWHEAHPVLSTIGTALGAAPFAVAATPLLSAVGEAAAPVLANPYVDAALTSGFGAHGLNHAINEGINGWGDAAMTALELAPLGRLFKPAFEMGYSAAKPIFDKATTSLQNNYPALFDPYTSWDATLGYHGDNIFSRALGTFGRRHGFTPKAEVPEFHRRLAINRPSQLKLDEEGNMIISSGRTGEGHDGIVNFATSEPARGHSSHKSLSGIDDYIIDSKAIGNQDFKSIQPSDTFFETGQLAIDPKSMTLVSGNTEMLDYARSLGIRTLSSPRLRQLTASRMTKEDVINSRSEGIAKFLQNVGEIKYGKGQQNAGQIGEEMQRLTSMRGTPTMQDYSYFEGLTGLNSGVRPAEMWNGTKEQGLELFGNWGKPRRTPTFNHVAYAPASNIESIYREAKMGTRPWEDYYAALENMPSARQQLGLNSAMDTYLGEPVIPEGYLTVKPQVRTRVGDVEIDDPNLLYHLDRGNGVGAFSNQGAYVENGMLLPGIAKEGEVPYSWWNLGRPYSTSVNGHPMTRLMTATEDTPGMLHVRSQNYPIGQWNGKRGFVTNAEYVNPEGVNVSGNTYTLDPNYGWRKVFPEETSVAEWTMGKTAPQITAENAASITPEQWTAAQDAAIARGDMAEAQRLRDLHFKVSAPDTKVDIPLWTSSEEPFNSFDLSHFGETDSGFFGYGHYLTPLEKYAATYHPVNRKFYANIKNPYIGSNDQYFNRTQYVKDRLARRKENVMRNLRNGKLTNFSKKLGINENTSLEDAERLVDKYIADETVKWNDKYVRYADEFEGKDGVLSWRELQGVPNKQEGIYKEVVVPRGEQLKSADAVTYDDNGVRIPLGERDNFNINDIRYALLPTLGIGTMGTLYNQKAFGGKLYDDGGEKQSLHPNVGKAMQYFMNKGLTDYQAAGLVGNLMRESSLDYKAVNKGSNAYGLAQWLGDRKTNLFKRYGNNPTFEQQLDYVWDELNSTHKNGLRMLKASKSAEEAARNAMGYYEFSVGPEKAIANMIKHGQDGEGSMRKGVNFAMGIVGQNPVEYVPQMQLPPNYNVLQNWELPAPQYTLDELTASGTMIPAKELPLTTRIPSSGERPNALLDLLAQYQYLDSLLSQ